jgi:CBS-domain-containing membrane protein
MPTASDQTTPLLTLKAEVAADLMMPNPVSIRQDATVQEAIALLTDMGFSAAPVIDRAGRPVGVLSRSDLLVHDREKLDYLTPAPEYYHDREVLTERAEGHRKGFQLVNVDRTRVKDIMTPIVFSVTPETPIRKVVQEMLGLLVHRLFVVDASGVLVGVISATDILRSLA